MSEPFSYDLVEYPAYVHSQMHPSRLAAIARLHGLPAASPTACRLLEVGCGDGLQLLTLAQSYPDSRFVGVDLSATAIARGELMRARLGLDNLTLVAADLQDWDAGSEPFDYILAHGFWSWVPESVRARLLGICERLLAPAGIAYVSYNTLPGCHLRRMLWDAMRFHSECGATPVERVQRAMDCVDLLEQGMLQHRRYTAAMSGEIRDLRERFNPSVLFHDELAAINDPCMFSDFLSLAYRHGLGFLAEANYLEMSLKTVGEAVRPTLAGIAEQDLATKEQYLDFLTGRRFRQTLLCRASANPRSKPDVDAVLQLEATSALTADRAQPDEAGGMRFSRLDSSMSTDNPLLQHLLLACQARPQLPQPIEALVDDARATISSSRTREEDAAAAADFLLGASSTCIAMRRSSPSLPASTPVPVRSRACRSNWGTSAAPASSPRWGSWTMSSPANWLSCWTEAGIGPRSGATLRHGWQRSPPRRRMAPTRAAAWNGGSRNWPTSRTDCPRWEGSVCC